MIKLIHVLALYQLEEFSVLFANQWIVKRRSWNNVGVHVKVDFKDQCLNECSLWNVDTNDTILLHNICFAIPVGKRSLNLNQNGIIYESCPWCQIWYCGMIILQSFVVHMHLNISVEININSRNGISISSTLTVLCRFTSKYFIATCFPYRRVELLEKMNWNW